MLIRFRVANHRSIRNEHELSLIATEFDESAGRRTGLKHRGREVSAQPVAGVFGANASGKSNLLSGFRLMRDAVRDSFADWAKAPEVVPRQPFKLDPASREETTLFEVDLALGGDPVRYTYGFELSDERVEAEWLHSYPHGRRNVWFDREAGRPESEGGEFIFRGEGFKGGREPLVRLTRPNALFLSVGATLNDPQLSAIHRWFLDNLWLVTPGRDLSARVDWTKRLLTRSDQEESYHQRITRLLQSADLGVTRLDTDPETGEIRLWHRTPDGGETPLDFRTEESLGTHAWFAFLGPMLTVLDQGSVLLVDELDSSLHPTLAAEVVRVFQDPASNPHDAQLIFTTHDATLLGSEVLDRPLNRDQVWITVKQRSGETELYPLTEAKPRKEENLERGYLRGRYGGVPRVTAGKIVRELSRQEAK
ncbi:ATP-binding protein [Streptosporangium sp. NBC_01755]|uniref:AAA family ATPase n=1 Tax=unclassified Streptosporangium TaxID=2632669 RepID=UPI002DDC63EE|nr:MULTISPECIES: ATP-binding protein [unclassified Streptosporangium]WSA24374.1 ATP-binding protein [Streptosporangium sp. NBC_01810]WSC97552.1 ATP-binding protein [Streptosporangium sp. NBC_01755]